MIALNYPYQQKIADEIMKVQKLGYNTWEPYNSGSGFAGGSYAGGAQQFAQAYEQPYYPYYNMVDLRNINSGKQKPIGGVRANEDKIIDSMVKKIDQNFDLEELSGSSRSGGSISLSKMKDTLLPVVKKYGVSTVLDIGIPVIATALTVKLGVPFVAPVAAKALRELAREVTGKGRKVKKMKGEGVDSLVSALVSVIESGVNTNATASKIYTEMKPLVIPLLKKSAGKALDYGIPKLGEEVGKILGHEQSGKILGKIAREIFKSKTGIARPQKRDKQEDKSGEARPQKRPAKPKSGVGEYKGGKKPQVGGKREERNTLIRKIMSERKVNLPTASKIIKEEGLL